MEAGSSVSTAIVNAIRALPWPGVAEENINPSNNTGLLQLRHEWGDMARDATLTPSNTAAEQAAKELAAFPHCLPETRGTGADWNPSKCFCATQCKKGNQAGTGSSVNRPKVFCEAPASGTPSRTNPGKWRKLEVPAATGITELNQASANER